MIHPSVQSQISFEGRGARRPNVLSDEITLGFSGAQFHNSSRPSEYLEAASWASMKFKLHRSIERSRWGFRNEFSRLAFTGRLLYASERMLRRSIVEN